MQHGRHARGSTSQLEFEDVITVDLPDDGYVDRTYLRAVFRDPYNYLPPRSRRSRRYTYPCTGRESILARRAKQGGLLAAIGALVCAIVTAAMMTEHPARDTATEQQRTRHDVAALGAFTVADSAAPSHPDSATTPAQSDTSQGQATRETSRSRGTPPAGEHRPHSRQHAGTTSRHNDAAGDGAAAEKPGAVATDTSDRAGAPTSNSDPTPEGTGRAGSPGAESPGAESSSPETTSGESGRVETVREFYSDAADSPEDAAELLVPALLGEGLETLRTTWQSFTAVRVGKVHEREDGKVRATLTVHEPGGAQLHLTQLFSFAESGLIGHIQLLSAQRD